MTMQNPVGLAAAKRQTTNGDRAVIHYGMELWEDICDEFTLTEIFSIRDVVRRLSTLPKWQGFKPRTLELYIRATVSYVMAEERGDDPKPLEKIGPKYRFTSAPSLPVG